jgi:hypothetical protein
MRIGILCGTEKMLISILLTGPVPHGSQCPDVLHPNDAEVLTHEPVLMNEFFDEARDEIANTSDRK